MKTLRRQLPIPQSEFGFAAQAFNLFTDTALDGWRVTAELEAAELLPQRREKAQHKFRLRIIRRPRRA